jgi:DNA modification methylase
MIEKFLNKIINDDCINILKQLPDSCVDMTFADPPHLT